MLEVQRATSSNEDEMASVTFRQGSSKEPDDLSLQDDENHDYYRVSFISVQHNPERQVSPAKVGILDKIKQISTIILMLTLTVTLITAIVIFVLYFKNNFQNRNNFENTSDTSKVEDSLIEENFKRAQFVRNMTAEAWKAYRDYAWGDDSLKPVSKAPHNELFGAKSGRTLISSMSTLWVMGLMDEFELAKQWIKDEFNLAAIDHSMNVCDLVTDFIGGLLSCFALSDEQVFLEKAAQIADLLEPAYGTASGLPYEIINPKTQFVQNYENWLTWAGGQQLEYAYLTQIQSSSSKSWTRRSNRIRHSLYEVANKTRGLYMEKINVKTKEWASKESSLAWAGRQWYANLAKSYIQSNGNDLEAVNMFNEAMDAAEQANMFRVWHGSRYVTWSKAGDTFMKYYACYLGGLLSLTANALERNFIEKTSRTLQYRVKKYRKLAQEITETCHFAMNRSQSGLAPYMFYFNDKDSATNLHYKELGKENTIYETGHFLNPELAESYFILWRRTKNQVYRDFAWEMVQALHANARIGSSGGYSQVKDATQLPTSKLDYQPPYFIGGTLKYLYLTFVDDSVLPLDKWVFSTVGQPFPISPP